MKKSLLLVFLSVFFLTGCSASEFIDKIKEDVGFYKQIEDEKQDRIQTKMDYEGKKKGESSAAWNEMKNVKIEKKQKISEINQKIINKTKQIADTKSSTSLNASQIQTRILQYEKDLKELNEEKAQIEKEYNEKIKDLRGF